MDIELLALGRVSVVECLTSSASLLGHLAFDLKGHHNFFGLRGRRKAPQVVKSSFTYVRRRQPPSIGIRTAKIFLPHPIFQISTRNPPSSLPKKAPSPSEFPFFPKEKKGSAEGAKFPCARKKIFLRTKIFFLTYGNLFSYVRKFGSLRTSIFRLPHGAKFSCARKKISFRKKIYFRT